MRRRCCAGTCEVIRLYSEFVRAQMRSLAELAAEMGQLVSLVAWK
jgi:hypothetical protein